MTVYYFTSAFQNSAFSWSVSLFTVIVSTSHDMCLKTRVSLEAIISVTSDLLLFYNSGKPCLLPAYLWYQVYIIEFNKVIHILIIFLSLPKACSCNYRVSICSAIMFVSSNFKHIQNVSHHWYFQFWRIYLLNQDLI